MSDDFDAQLLRMDKWIGGLMAGMAPAERRKAAQRIAAKIRGQQARQIASQKNPDGSAFEAKKPKKEQVQINRALKFLYPSGGSGKPRVVLMKRWRKEGALLVGYDIKTGGQRSFAPDKIIRWLPVSAAEQNKRAGKLRRPTIRQMQMFRKLRTFRMLHKHADASGAEVGFSGVAGGIAAIHQEGKFDTIGEDGPRIRYPVRQLLGFSGEEDMMILDIMTDMLEHAAA